MKKYLLFLFLVVVLGACDNQPTVTNLETQFDQAISFNDNLTAIVYLHEIKALDPDNNTVYKRLADLYNKTGNYKGAIKAADVALKKANELETKDLLFIKAKANKKLRKNADAIAVFDTLAQLDKKRELEYKYETAVLYFEMQDFSNAQMRMEEVMRHPLANKTEKRLQSDFGIDKVSYRAAAINFIAYIKLLSGDFNTAERLYTDLFAQTEQFKLAKSNYQLLQRQKKLKAKKEKEEAKSK